MGTGHRIPPGDLENLLLQQGGSSQDATAFGVVTVPMYRSTVIYSNAAATADFTGTYMTGLGYFKQMDVYVRLTSVSGTSPTLDLFADSRLDGTTNMNMAHFSQITTATTNPIARFSKMPGTAIFGSGGGDVGAGTILNMGWGDDVRVRGTVGGTSPSFSLTVTVSLIA